ncbi:MAG: hypothetical protein WBW04_23385 [Nitrolancea sp.]
MNPMTRITPRIDLRMLTAGLAGLLLGVALTFSIVLGTHWFERVRTVQVLTDTTSGIAQPAAVPAMDQSQVDAANMIRHDPVGQSPASAGTEQLRVDAENMIRHDPVGQSPASVVADQLRVEQVNMIRHDPIGQSPASIQADQARVDADNMIRHDPSLPDSHE